ncbi:hypothetical protein BJV77DRAFT_785767 [Russula vinacea]|nr:hypothetical protein BJV77DRAFT_785767 [Russula vinacea]
MFAERTLGRKSVHEERKQTIVVCFSGLDLCRRTGLVTSVALLFFPKRIMNRRPRLLFFFIPQLSKRKVLHYAVHTAYTLFSNTHTRGRHSTQCKKMVWRWGHYHLRFPPCEGRGDAGRPLPGRISAFTTGLQSYGILAGGHAMRVRLVRSCP